MSELAQIISLLSAIGFGSLLGIWYRARTERQQKIENQRFEFKEKRYGNISLLLITKIGTKDAANLRQMTMFHPHLTSWELLDRELRLELLNSILFASQRVVDTLGAFVQQATMQTVLPVFNAMREDLYGQGAALPATLVERLGADLGGDIAVVRQSA